MPKRLNNSITDVPGIKVGHAQNYDALTGCTVVLYEKGATGGVDQRGGAPGTRETDLLRPMHLVEHVHGILLTGGSAFGLDAATGIMQYLEEKGVGYNAGVARVPIVPGAVIFDLAVGDAKIRPDAHMGYQACITASETMTEQGNIGAGTGATVGKILGMKQAMKSGLGMASMDVGGGVIVSAIVIVNAFGDVVDPKSGQIIAGARPLHAGPLRIGKSERFADTFEVMKSLAGRTILGLAGSSNTVIGIVATNAKLSKDECNKVAQMAHNGLAMTIKPSHTMFDGDTIFTLATNQRRSDVNIIGAFGAQVMAQAVLNSVLATEPAGGLPSAKS